MKSIKNKSLSRLLFFLFLLITVTSCANKEVVDACLEGQKYNFFGGLWHGIIAPIDLILMLFRDDITVYAQNNTGGWYALGFLIGSGGWGILGGKKLGGKN